MITINYQTFGTKGFQLRLRLYQNGETRFVNVTKLLKGSIQKRHWNQRKQLFTPGCPYSEENNDTLVKFKKKYEDMAMNWQGPIFSMIAAINNQYEGDPDALTIHDFIESIVEELQERKHADGTTKGTFESYQKLDRRLEEYCQNKKVDYSKMRLEDMTPGFVDGVLKWKRDTQKGKGLVYVSVMLHSVMMRADKAGYLNADDYKRCKWQGKNRQSVQKYNTLTAEQCKKFISLTKEELPKNPKSELYRDFCTFILYTGQSACDAISLKYSDIKEIGGVEHFIFKRRKISEKQIVPCTVPINIVMRSIMERWQKQSRDGYVFPIRNKEKLKKSASTNSDIKHFVGRLNVWLKKVGKILGCNFPLHSYTFRHTAITHYLSKDIPVIYVANIMGTSVKNCESIYYNNQGDTDSRDKVMKAIVF